MRGQLPRYFDSDARTQRKHRDMFPLRLEAVKQLG